MPKEIVLTGLRNRIEYATTNGKGLITGKREDITDSCLDAVYAHLKTEFNRNEKHAEQFGYQYADGGQLVYIAPKKKTD